MIHSASAIFFGQELFDLPVTLLCTYAELEIFFCDGVPILCASALAKIFASWVSSAYFVDHHDGKQVADRCKKQSIQVVADPIAEGVTEDVQNDLSDDEEEHPKCDITQGPPVLKSIRHQDDLHDHINKQADGIEHV